MSGTASDKTTKRLMIVLLTFLSLCIAILATLVVVNALNNNTPDNTGGTGQEENFDATTATIDEVIAHYQNKIDGTSDNAEKVQLYDIRLKTIIEKDKNREYVNQVLSDVISIDDIEQTAASALQVCGYAEYFENKEIYDEYQSIYQERWNAEGGYNTNGGRG